MFLRSSCFLLLCASVASAQTATMRFTGTVSNMFGPAVAEFPNMQVGDAVTLRLVVDASDPGATGPQNLDLETDECSLQVGGDRHEFVPVTPNSFFYSPCDHGFDWITTQFSPNLFLEMPDSGSACLFNYNGGGCGEIPFTLNELASFGSFPLSSGGNGFSVLNPISGFSVELEWLHHGDEELELYCSPAQPHFQGGTVTLTNSAFASGSTMDLHIEASGGPAGQFGFFFLGPGHGPEFMVFNGTFCLSQPIGRYNLQASLNQGLPELNSLGQFDASGVLQNLSGTAASGTGFDVPLALPYSPAGQQIAPGDTWFFQLWYRDVDDLGQPSANYSDALSATFE